MRSCAEEKCVQDICLWNECHSSCRYVTRVLGGWYDESSNLIKALSHGYGRHQLMLSFPQMKAFLMVIDDSEFDTGFN